jgi:hypothetical protein
MELRDAVRAAPVRLLLVLGWVAAWVVGCDGDDEGPEPGDERAEAGGGASRGAGNGSGGDQAPTGGVCPSCQAGGETSDFGSGSQAACALALIERELDFAEAEALGFAVAAQRDAIEVPIDEPMRWNAQQTEAGGPATGFEPETRVTLTLSMESIAHFELDPEQCDSETCELDGGTQTEAEPCRTYIKVYARGELSTADGAIEVTFEPQPVRVLYGDAEEIRDLSVAAQANLADVRGSLRVDPLVPEPYVGRLDLSLQYGPDGTLAWGDIDISVYPDWDNLPEDSDIPSELSRYHPLRGHFGTEPPHD